MGQAKQRRASYEQTKAALISNCDGQAKIVASSAIKLFERFMLPNGFTGGCYQITMTLAKYFNAVHGIMATPVVGYVNDGTDDVMISHAWLDFEGKKVDLCLFLMEHPEITKPGPLLVLDVALMPGLRPYTYHMERPERSLKVVEEILGNPSTREVVRRKELEHSEMLARSQDLLLIDAYLAQAPARSNFSTMTSLLD